MGKLLTKVLLFLVFLLALGMHGQSITNKHSFLQLENTYSEETPWRFILSEIEKGKTELEKLNLEHSPKTITYTEPLKNSTARARKRKITDFAWKEIGLKLLNLDSGNIKIIKIKKVGPKLINIERDFIITIEGRPSGLLWNGWNTAFRVEKIGNNSHWIVILNKYPRRLKNGKCENLVYAPYSTFVHLKELVSEGRTYLRAAILKSLAELEESGIGSRGDFFDSVDSFERLTLIEQTDPFEFNEFLSGRWPLSPFERVYIILALNKDTAYGVTSSPAAANGLMQFTNQSRERKPGTWDLMRKKYSQATLPPFNTGTRNHIESIKAAILLQNYNLEVLETALGEKITEDPNLEHYLAAGYNGGIGPVVKAIQKSQAKGTGWRQELRKLKKTNESLDYLNKLDYLLANKNQPP